jgi:hypothetical protein
MRCNVDGVKGVPAAVLSLALGLKMGRFLKTCNIYLSRKVEPFGSSE